MAFEKRGSRPVHYPESDGKPLAETEIHLKQIADLYASLRHHFRREPEMHVSADLLLYYVENRPDKVVAPDVMVIPGIPPGLRRVYKVWEEGKVPAVVFEITSASSRVEDVSKKKDIYAKLGVREYYIFDPTHDYLKPPFRAYRLHGGEYLDNLERPCVSAVLGLEIRVMDGWLRLVDPATAQPVPIPDDLAVLAEEKAARVAAEQRALAAEQELHRLRARLGEGG